MKSISLTVMYNVRDQLRTFEEALHEFTLMTGAKVRVRAIPWEQGWSELIKVALYKLGPDVSEIGTSWVEGMVTMEALRFFPPAEVERIKGEQKFLEASWETSLLAGDERVWSIPWLADTRLVYYRRDLFAKAGIDEKEAFRSWESFYKALEKLEGAGVEVPLSMSTVDEHPILHIAASFIWGAGGDFMSQDGREVLFNSPEAIEGLICYYSLHRFIPPQVRFLNDDAANEAFRAGKAAVTISGQWVLFSVDQGDAAPEVVENLGIALVPGVPFVGGANLVIWQHSYHHSTALELIRFLTSVKMQEICFRAFWMLPTRVEALSKEPFTTDLNWKVVRESLVRGKAFKGAYMWGMVEDALVSTLASIWKIVFTEPKVNIRGLLKEHLDGLAHTIESALYDRFWRKH